MGWPISRFALMTLAQGAPWVAVLVIGAACACSGATRDPMQPTEGASNAGGGLSDEPLTLAGNGASSSPDDGIIGGRPVPAPSPSAESSKQPPASPGEALTAAPQRPAAPMALPRPIGKVSRPHLRDVAFPDRPAPLSAAAQHFRQGRLAAAERALRAVPPAGVGPEDLYVQLHVWALRGAIHQRAGQPRAADREYQKVVDAWQDPQTIVREIRARVHGDSDRQRRTAHCVNAVGEALFHFAEQERAQADRITVPRYRGSGTVKDVERFVQTRTKQWMEKKREALERAVRAYLKVVDLKPAAAPFWVIASGSRVGALWIDFVRDFRAAPTPREWLQDGPRGPGKPSWQEIRNHYWLAVARATEPQLERGRAALQVCRDWAARHKIEGPFVDSCKSWLAAHPRAQRP